MAADALFFEVQREATHIFLDGVPSTPVSEIKETLKEIFPVNDNSFFFAPRELFADGCRPGETLLAP